jgi:hypothetical protein
MGAPQSRPGLFGEDKSVSCTGIRSPAIYQGPVILLVQLLTLDDDSKLKCLTAVLNWLFNDTVSMGLYGVSEGTLMKVEQLVQ